jgi:hypothetical protein
MDPTIPARIGHGLLDVINALTVLAIHAVHYTDPDLVVVGVFDEGVGGGLVMDGRLRRGDNGHAMDVGHSQLAHSR